MHRVPQCLVQARSLQQVPIRIRSTAAAAQDVANEVTAKPQGWDSARPFSEVPGPKPLPIIGNVWRFMPVIGEFHKIGMTEFFMNFVTKYGNISRMGGIPGKPDVIIVNDPNEVAQIFRNEGTWPQRQGADSLEHYFTHIRKGYPVSLIVSQGKEWQEFRSAINQVMMRPSNTKQYVEPIDQVSQEFIARMRDIRQDNLEMPPDFFNEIAKWALESISYVALDTRLGLLGNLEADSEGSKMIQAVHTVFDSMYVLDFLPSAWRWVSTPEYRKFINSMEYFTEVAVKYVTLAMDRLKNLPPTETDKRNFSVLENLLVKTGEPEKAVTMALDMLLAGVDTTGTVIATVMYQLANNPEKQKKLQDELDRVIPDPSKCLTNQQLEDMKYLRACIKETMRVMPIVIGNSRTTVKDMVIGGYQVPPGTLISMSAKTISDNELNFPRALEFLPERWLPGHDDLKGKNPFAFLPFGFGPRMCAGRRFADLEIETLMAKTFRNFTLEWNRPPAANTFQIIFKFTDPLCFTVKDRL